MFSVASVTFRGKTPSKLPSTYIFTVKRRAFASLKEDYLLKGWPKWWLLLLSLASQILYHTEIVIFYLQASRKSGFACLGQLSFSKRCWNIHETPKCRTCEQKAWHVKKSKNKAANILSPETKHILSVTCLVSICSGEGKFPIWHCSGLVSHSIDSLHKMHNWMLSNLSQL